MSTKLSLLWWPGPSRLLQQVCGHPKDLLAKNSLVTVLKWLVKLWPEANGVQCILGFVVMKRRGRKPMHLEEVTNIARSACTAVRSNTTSIWFRKCFTRIFTAVQLTGYPPSAPHLLHLSIFKVFFPIQHFALNPEFIMIRTSGPASATRLWWLPTRSCRAAFTLAAGPWLVPEVSVPWPDAFGILGNLPRFVCIFNGVLAAQQFLRDRFYVWSSCTVFDENEIWLSEREVPQIYFTAIFVLEGLKTSVIFVALIFCIVTIVGLFTSPSFLNHQPIAKQGSELVSENLRSQTQGWTKPQTIRNLGAYSKLLSWRLHCGSTQLLPLKSLRNILMKFGSWLVQELIVSFSLLLCESHCIRIYFFGLLAPTLRNHCAPRIQCCVWLQFATTTSTVSSMNWTMQSWCCRERMVKKLYKKKSSHETPNQWTWASTNGPLKKNIRCFNL